MNNQRLHRIGVLTSGGDAPGMNACLRAIVRTAVYHNLEVIGFQHGYRGVLLGEYQVLDARSVANIIQRGGTILGSARCPEMHHAEGVERAAKNLKGLGIDALLVIGGNGSMQVQCHYQNIGLGKSLVCRAQLIMISVAPIGQLVFSLRWIPH
nr:6-phosphofructokinase [Chromatium okenii]